VFKILLFPARRRRVDVLPAAVRVEARYHVTPWNFLDRLRTNTQLLPMTNARHPGIHFVMTRRQPLLRCILLLMLSAGPIQAQTVLLCDMMEVPRQETCCCDGPEPARECDEPQCHVAPRAEADGCCDSKVEVSYEADAGPTIARPADHRTGLDPPHPILVAYELAVPPRTAARPPIPRPVSVAIADGSNLYLVTERLRI
jgi:hypothetical protein